MSLTAHQLSRRGLFLNASEAAAALALSPWLSRADFAMGKIALIRGEEIPHDVNEDAVALGHAVEPSLIRWACEQIGVERSQFRANQSRVAADGIFACTFDALSFTGDVAIEAKSHLIAFQTNEEYGDEGTDEIPIQYLIQVSIQFHCVPSLARVYVPVWFRAGRKLYMVAREQAEATLEWALPELRQVWNCILAGVIPEGDTPSLTVLKQLRREERAVDVDPIYYASAREWKAVMDATNAEAKAAKKCYDYAVAVMVNAMGSANRGVCPEGELTIKTITRKAYSVEASEYKKIELKPRKESE